MHHRCLPVICPLSLIYIVGVLLEASRVKLSEIGVLRLVRCRLSYIIKACPQELSHGKFSIPVHGYAVFAVLRSPVGRTVAKSGTLFIIITQNLLLIRKLIYATALERGGSLASVYNPVRVSLMVLLVVFLRIIISGKLHYIRTFLRVLPRHV